MEGVVSCVIKLHIFVMDENNSCLASHMVIVEFNVIFGILLTRRRIQVSALFWCTGVFSSHLHAKVMHDILHCIINI
ncbi:hypothetical protein Ahy_B01g056429 isoform B [Arachis hypogaea]|uniref:Uncharacterized protein n=1 Tax=Arachis hypogaea TaxID=3818 RepID=A0A445AYW7_ARAHY|nr:hypothetical protein Ahy_B01g056429 isoform B [Arachis hypogaea]